MSETVENAELNVGHVAKRLTPEEIDKMRAQDSRLVSEFRANQLERDAKKHWDLFYKRNDTRFFKDRHWTTREFNELLGLGGNGNQNVLLEVGCGVGNFIYPLIEDGLKFRKILVCDLSTRAIELLKVHLANYNCKLARVACRCINGGFLVESHVIPSGYNKSLSNGCYVRKLFR